PRFRDCFAQQREWENDGEIPYMGMKNDEEEPNTICVFTRVGGGNRESYVAEIKELQKHENYLFDYDDSFDSTYATFVFNVPDEFKEDYKKVVDGKLEDTSKSYQERFRKVFPKLEDTYDKVFAV